MTDIETHVLSIQDLPFLSTQGLPSHQHTVDNERIAELEKTIASLRSSLIELAKPGRVLELGCDLSPHQHHYRMPSGLCACQDKSWAR